MGLFMDSGINTSRGFLHAADMHAPLMIIILFLLYSKFGEPVGYRWRVG
jgi:hypothetical protein